MQNTPAAEPKARKNKKTKAPTNFVDGKLRPEVVIRKHRTIDEVLGRHRYDKYSTMEEAEYQESIDNMLKVDLQGECLRVGLIPHDRTDLMKQRLMKTFKTYVACVNTSDLHATNPPTPSKSSRNILSRMVVGTA